MDLAEMSRRLNQELLLFRSGFEPVQPDSRELFTRDYELFTRGRALVEALAELAAAAGHTGDRTLAKAVFAESHRRGHGDLMQQYLQGNEEAREAFGEFSQIPSAEEREQAVERVVRAIPEPTHQQIASTQEAQARAQEQNVNMRPMAG